MFAERGTPLWDRLWAKLAARDSEWDSFQYMGPSDDTGKVHCFRIRGEHSRHGKTRYAHIMDDGIDRAAPSIEEPESMYPPDYEPRQSLADVMPYDEVGQL